MWVFPPFLAQALFGNTSSACFFLGSSQGITETGYGTTSVWCLGGSRYDEGCRGFPYLKMKMFKVSWLVVSCSLVSNIVVRKIVRKTIRIKGNHAKTMPPRFLTKLLTQHMFTAFQKNLKNSSLHLIRFPKKDHKKNFFWIIFQFQNWHKNGTCTNTVIAR